VNKGKLLLALKERLLGKHFPNQYGGPIQEGRTTEENNKTSNMNKSDSLSLVQGPYKN
jgi:hypothetical protein